MKIIRPLFLSLCALSLYACKKDKPQEPLKSLVYVEREPPGARCTTGGLAIRNGLDKNYNNTLDPDEYVNTYYACNGTPWTWDPTWPEANALQLKISAGGGGSGTTRGQIFGPFSRLSKKRFNNVKSIIFAGVPYMEYNSTSGSCIMELYDWTNKKAIANSQITGKSLGYDFLKPPPYVYSNNIYNDLPDEEIEVGLQVRATIDGQGALSGPAMLLIFQD